MNTAFRVSLLSILLFVSLAPLTAQSESRAASSKKRTIHEVKLAGVYKDLAEQGFSSMSLLAGGGAKPSSFYELIDNLDGLCAYPAASEVLFDLSDPAFHVNAPQIAELERAVDRLRAAGAKTVAYLENAGMPQFVVASLCDRVLMADVGSLEVAAPSISILFMKDALDLLGVQFQIMRAGQFKGAVEPYMLSEMSSHLRQHYVDMIASMNERLVAVVSTHRKITPEKVHAAQARRLFSASDAKAAGLVDELVGWRGARFAVDPTGVASFESVPKKKKKEPFNFLAMLSGSSKAKKEVAEDSFAVLHLSGEIVDGDKESPGSIVSGPTVTLVKELRDNAKIKGVVVRVNSPGGSGTASEAIVLALRELATKKPVVVSMGDLAASGGYYVSMIGGPIFAEHSTITGSIGVFGMRPNIGALARRIGLKNEIISLDDSSGMTDMFRPLTDTQLEQLQTHVLTFYDHFRARILEVRKDMKPERLLEIAGGRVWTGKQALDLGLVDKIGGLGDAVAWLKDKTKSELPLVAFPQPDNNPLAMLEQVFGGASIFEPSQLKAAQLGGFTMTTPLRILADALENRAPFRVWAVMPLEIRLN